MLQSNSLTSETFGSPVSTPHASCFHPRDSPHTADTPLPSPGGRHPRSALPHGAAGHRSERGGHPGLPLPAAASPLAPGVTVAAPPAPLSHRPEAPGSPGRLSASALCSAPMAHNRAATSRAGPGRGKPRRAEPSRAVLGLLHPAALQRGDRRYHPGFLPPAPGSGQAPPGAPARRSSA